jgi:2-oxoglutarate/2-oxoacid ferredoxin oxidoreductase subunit beta
MSTDTLSPVLTVQEFSLDTQVKWCPGCGGHAILSSIKKALPETTTDPDKVVFVSGIGCSSRFPYYIKTYGFHSLHGRATAIASGVKIANPELQVWIVTGDGDSMAIGGNHFIHQLRRNLDVNILLFNNKIYGLTKGQYSPTTPIGSVTKTSPEGTIEQPFLPGELAMGSQATFFARAVDNDPNMMKEVFVKASQHKGTSLVEIFQNCVIFSNQVHAEVTGKEVRHDHQIYLQHGKPMIFGKNNDKGLILKGIKLEVVEIGKNGVRMEDILVHDAHSKDSTIQYMLSRMDLPEYPMAMGVIRSVDAPVYEELLDKQIDEAKQKSKIHNVNELLHSGNTFLVE